MKKLMFIFALLFACAGASEDGYEDGAMGEVSPYPIDEEGVMRIDGEDVDLYDQDLVQYAQALTRPNGYGINHTNGTRCSSTSNCDLPKDKTFSRRFLASTCSNWWQTRFVEADNDFLFIDRDLDWTVNGPSGQFADFYWQCGTVGGSNNGIFQPTLSAQRADGSYTWNSGWVTVDAAFTEAGSSWAGKTDVQRQRMARNIILHELMHSVGLGHATSALTNLMHGADPVTWYQGLKYSNTDEINMLDNYVP
jgi:hypothetical protein